MERREQRPGGDDWGRRSWGEYYGCPGNGRVVSDKEVGGCSSSETSTQLVPRGENSKLRELLRARAIESYDRCVSVCVCMGV